MIKYYIVFCLSLFFVNISYGQIVLEAKEIDLFQSEINDYLKHHGYLTKDEGYSNYRIIEAVEKKTFGYSADGIYEIQIHKSHSKSLLFLFDGKNIEFLNIDHDLSGALMKSISYLKDKKKPQQLIYKYLDKILFLYNSNMNLHPIRAVKNKVANEKVE